MKNITSFRLLKTYCPEIPLRQIPYPESRDRQPFKNKNMINFTMRHENH